MKTKKLWSQDLYLRAIHFAAEAHKDQKFLGTDLPYIVHLSSVAMEVMGVICIENIKNPDLAVQCALLHDTLEDTEIQFNDIEKNFGKDVAQGVLALTKNRELDKKFQMHDSIERIKLQPKEIRIVKLADRITNMESPPSHWTRDKIIDYKSEADYILKSLGSASPFLEQRLKTRIENYD
ncbi:MAG: HD domain-containing protein [Leptospirales bacterium]|nr:HD domain-containing protein [Leptospirales bacterium]